MGPNGKLLNGNVGSSRRGGRTEIGGPSLMTVGLGADFRIAHCAPISLGPTRYSPSLLLPSAVFLHRHHRPAAQREKIPHPPHTRLRTRLSKWRAQRESFERERGNSLAGQAVELDSGRGRPQTCTVCNNSDSHSLLAHPHFFFRAPFPLTVGACLDVCILCTRLSK